MGEQIRHVAALSFPQVLDCLESLSRPPALEALARNDWCTRKASAQVLGGSLRTRQACLSFASSAARLKSTVGSDWRSRLALESASKLLTKHLPEVLSSEDAACIFAGLLRDRDSRVFQSAMSVLLQMFDDAAIGGVGQAPRQRNPSVRGRTK